MTLATRWTPKELRKSLEKSGRYVTERVLTDWRGKGLLPQLKGRGKGRGRGVGRYWDEPDILEHAVVVHDALSLIRRTYYAQWVLWFCGFSVPPDIVQKIWLRILESGRIKRRAEPGELPADKYTDKIELLSKQLERNQKLDPRDADPIAREIVIATNEHPKIGIDQFEHVELLRAVARLVDDRKLLGDSGTSVTSAALSKMQHFERSFISLKAIKGLLNSASDKEFLRAQNYLRLLGSLLSTLAVAEYPTTEAENEILKLRILSASSFTPPIFRLILMVMKSGQERQLELSVPLITKLRGRFLAGFAKGQKDARSQALFRQLFNVWKDLDVNKLYNLA